MSLDIIALAKEAHGPITGQWFDMDVAALERFADLIIERCAVECEQTGDRLKSEWMANNCAAAIRALKGRVE